MKGERRLSLVKPPADKDGEAADPKVIEKELEALGLAGEDLEVSAEELAAAEELRRAMERGDEPIARALRAAVEPAPLPAGDLDAILARALGDEDAAPTAVEQAEAERLRVALEESDAQRAGRLVAGPGARAALPEESTAATAVALRAAWAPSPIGAARNDALVSKALGSASEGKGSHVAPHIAPVARKERGSAEAPAPISLRRFRMGPRTFATMTAVAAMAAGVLLLFGKLGQREAAPPPAAVAMAPAASAAAAPGQDRPSERVPLIAARSTQELFDASKPFPRSGGESARVDRIATARAADLRANRFAAWGVR
jgi:hypothetical protein